MYHDNDLVYWPEALNILQTIIHTTVFTEVGSLSLHYHNYSEAIFGQGIW